MRKACPIAKNAKVKQDELQTSRYRTHEKIKVTRQRNKHGTRERARRRQKLPGKAEKAKKLSAEAAGMPDQPARGGPRVGEYNEGRVVDEWQSTGRGRDTMDQARQGGACV